LSDNHAATEEEEKYGSVASSITNNTACAHTEADLDPLTAMVMEEDRRTQSLAEMDLHYRKERARRKRNGGGAGGQGRQILLEAEDESYDDSAAALEIIDKDLVRLHTSQDKSVLRSVLFVYHCHHSPDPGYRQGMHEVASYLLQALVEEPSFKDEGFGGSGSNGDSAQQEVEAEQERLVAGEVYAMLEIVLTQIAPAYDVATPNDPKPLEAMGRRILALVGRADPQVWDRLQSLQVPPAIYLTKWIRLLFGREVRSVLELWDVVFELSSSSSTSPTGEEDTTTLSAQTLAPALRQQRNNTLLAVLEAVAAARILHHRREILLGDDDTLHFLMNVPVEPDIAPIVDLARTLLSGQPVSLPPMVDVPIYPSAAAATSSSPVPPPRSSPTLLRSSLLSRATAFTPGPTTGATTTSTTTATGTPALSAALSTMKQQFTEALDRTSTISKRLYHEWENLSADKSLDDPQIRSYDDDVWHAPPFPPAAATLSSTNSTAGVGGRPATDAFFGPALTRSAVSVGGDPLSSGDISQPPSYYSHPLSSCSQQPSSPAASIAAEMEGHLAALHSYCANAQLAHRDVPPVVWESLARLEHLRRALLLLAVPSSSSSPPHRR
jgi:hypothetical protein